MTIPSNVTRNSYTGTGITGPYPVTFKFFEDADLKVTVGDTNGIETVKTLTTDYTVTGAGEQSGGSITFTTAVANGYSIVIEPKADLTQDTDIKNEGGNLRESIEDRFDRLCRDDQVQQNLIDRSVKMQVTDASVADPVLPPREAGALLGWNDDGTGFANRAASLFSSDATVVATGSTASRWVSDRFADSVHVKDFGAVGDGVADDTAAIQAAVARIVTLGGGTLNFEQDGVYSLTVSSYGGAPLFDFSGCSGVCIEGNGALIKTNNNSASPWVIYLDDVSGATVRNLNFESLYTTLSGSNGPIWIYVTNGTKNVSIENCSFVYGLGGLIASGISDPVRASGIQMLNCDFTSTYYPMNFQGNGDNFFARNIVTRNSGRSYFPWNVKNHDVQVDSKQGGSFSDCLLKVYSYSTGEYSMLENIKLDYTSSGRYSGSGAQGSEEAFVAIDMQQADGTSSAGSILNVDVTIRADCNAVDTNSNLFIVRKYTSAGAADSTTRNHVVRNLKISGYVSNAHNLTQDGVRLFSVAGGMAWTGENLAQIVVSGLSMTGTDPTQTDLYINCQANAGTGQNFIVENVVCSGTISTANYTAGCVGINRSKFSNLSRLEGDVLPYTPAITSYGGGDISGIASEAVYVRSGPHITVHGRITVNDSTKMGSGIIYVGLPTTSRAYWTSVGSYQGLAAAAWRTGGTVSIGGESKFSMSFDNAGNFLTSASFAWANTNHINFTHTYLAD